jgi:dihydrofolate reductase
MGQIIISTNASLDGVVQDPGGDEGFREGGWFVRSGGADLGSWNEHSMAEAVGAEALLLGRRTEEWFAARWPGRTGEFADRLNSMPKYVVSSTRTPPRWSNTTLLDGDVIEQVAKLRQDLDGEILVYASYQLGQTLLEHDLVDEVRLVVFPVVIGAGKRLFGVLSGSKPLTLTGAHTIGEGLALLTYRR